MRRGTRRSDDIFVGCVARATSRARRPRPPHERLFVSSIARHQPRPRPRRLQRARPTTPPRTARTLPRRTARRSTVAPTRWTDTRRSPQGEARPLPDRARLHATIESRRHRGGRNHAHCASPMTSSIKASMSSASISSSGGTSSSTGSSA